MATWKPSIQADGSDITGHKSDHLVSSWRPSIHMPRWACRIILEITNIRVERVQDISEDDAIADGGLEAMIEDHIWYIPGTDSKTTRDPIYAFEHIWNACHSARGLGWDVNPWVWVIDFKRVEG